MPLIKYYEEIVYILGISQFPPPNYFIVFNPSNNHTSIEKSGLKTMFQSSKALQGYRSYVQCMNTVEHVEFGNFHLTKESASIMLQKDFFSQMKISAYMLGTPALEQPFLKPKKAPS